MWGDLFSIVLRVGVLLWELPLGSSFTCGIYHQFRRAYCNGMIFYRVVSLTLEKVGGGGFINL